MQTPKEKDFIAILDEFVFDSPSLPGNVLNLNEFKNWIANAESSSAIDLKDVKAKWENKKADLQN